MDTNKKIREHISALADGELSNADLELAFAALRTQDGHRTWEVYHRIGDVLRGQAATDLSPAFSDKLAARLAKEAAPIRRPVVAASETEPATPVLTAPRA